MKKYLIFLALGFSMLLSTYAIAAPWTNVLGYTPFAYERITVTNAAVSQLNAATELLQEQSL